jgi:hypothetical protein
MSKINKLIEKELATFDRSIVATPQDRTSLDIFAKCQWLKELNAYRIL